MADMLVKLYDLKNDWSFVAEQEANDIIIRKPVGGEGRRVVNWVLEAFGESWASQANIAVSQLPMSCFVAIHDHSPVGFACYDATALGFFGPMGLGEAYRGKGAGKALLLACLLDMKLKGYGYAIIGGAGPSEFYRKTVGATEIPDSFPGIYRTTREELG